ncbi:hypothetical protein BKK49_12520, partial [Rodentibacter rarus]
FDYLEKLMSLKSISLLDIDDVGFNCLPECWKILLQQLEKLNICGWMYNLKNLPFEHLTNLKRLSIPDERLDNINELENLTNLEELEIGYINFDIQKLTGLIKLKANHIRAEHFEMLNKMENLKSLSLYEVTHGKNKETVKALSKAIGEMTQLEELNLEGCYNINLNCLRKLKNLKSLNISRVYENKLKPIIALANSLEKLDLSYNDFVDLHLLSHFKKLKWLKIRCSIRKERVLDLKFLRSLKELEYFEYSSMNKLLGEEEKWVKNFSCIRFCQNLKKLYCESAGVRNIKSLKYCKKLECLIMDNNHLNHISDLKHLNNLREVSLSKCNLYHIESLRNKSNLTLLDISDNFITDISPLEHSKKLKNLIVDQREKAKISDISVLEDKIQLEELDLASNNISDISPLRKLINLILLDISDNPINKNQLNYLSNFKKLDYLGIDSLNLKEIKFISKLINIEELNLAGNRIEDYTPLLPLKKLYYLDIEYSNVKDCTIFTKQNFPELDFDFLEN